MKRIIALLLTLLFALTLFASCGGKSTTEESAPSIPSPELSTSLPQGTSPVGGYKTTGTQ